MRSRHCCRSGQLKEAHNQATGMPLQMELHPDSASKSLRKTGGVLLLKRQVDVQALLLQNVLAALERREYAVLVYDGPGQGQVRL